MPKVIRVGDPLSHGGSVIEGSPDVYTNGIQTARLTDSCSCAIHGLVAITSASDTTFANNLGIARVGDTTTCGATLLGGSPDTYVDGVFLAVTLGKRHV